MMTDVCYKKTHQPLWQRLLRVCAQQACAWVLSRSVVSGSATPWTAVCQASLSMEFSRLEYWSGVPLPSPAPKDRYYYFSGFVPIYLV